MSNPMLDEYLNRSAYAETTGGNRWPHMQDGHYTLILVKYTMKKFQSGFCAIPELFVEESSPAGYEVPAGVVPNAVGSMLSCVWNFDHPTAGKSAGGNVQEFICAMPDGEPPPAHPSKGGDPGVFAAWAEKYKKWTAQLCSEQQPGRGLKIKAHTRRSKNMVFPSWEKLPGQTIETLKAARERLSLAGY